MKLEVGKTYVNGWGDRRRVMGPTRDHPEWCWTVSGDWYTWSGQKVSYDAYKGHYVMPPSNWDLVTEVPQ